jgi:hypothetical protein
MSALEISRERSTYSPSLACHQRFRPFWIDARSGCRFSASDRQSIRDRAKIRNARGVVVDRYPGWKGHGESFHVTKIARPRLAAALLAQHEAHPKLARNPKRLAQLRAEYAMLELEQLARFGLEGKALAAEMASNPDARAMMREMIALAEA